MTTTALELFGISMLPFGKNIPSESLFQYPQLEELKRQLSLALLDRSMALVTGQAGIGKSTAVRSFTDNLPANTHQVIYLGQDQNGTSLLKRLALSLGLVPRFHRAHLTLQISHHLIDNMLEGGKEVVLVVDESHFLDDATLEALRLMTNADFDRTSPITIVLLGQLSLRSRLKSTGFEALNQRLKWRYALEGLTKEETAAYIQHHLQIVGCKDNIFSDSAIQLVFFNSGGIPREINNICLSALLRAAASGAKKIDDKLIRQVLALREVG